MPIGVSIIAQIFRPSGAPAASRCASASAIIAAVWTFGSSTAWAGMAAAAVRSSAPQGVSSPLTRTTSSRGPYPPVSSAAAMAERAAAFSDGMTASSRSRISTSAASVRAFSSARGFEPGM